ncbi:N-acetyl-gamma-glutamyl-phosphate reductase [Candidatus Chlorohelix sp.]|uniref:N-acetyl-gamma-glutamyl-phosphate reductase n=1 Tax=Candidatus Chlorohelix sp. TaxID=3139201 RepID=UPI003020F982
MSGSKIRVGIVGGSGYTGGELLRILLGHPHVEVTQITSETNSGKFVHIIHPNLRKRTELKFISMTQLEECDVLFLALPHGSAMGKIDKFAQLAPRIIDLSADFRLRDPADYPKWYEHEHPNREWLSKFVYGIPELHREQIRESNYVTGAGCSATAVALGLMPLFKHGLVDTNIIVAETKIGSSAAGNKPSLSGHHPERSGVSRIYQATGHRHSAEIIQELSFGTKPNIHLTVTSVEAVRGILATCHVFLKENLQEKDIWKVYRQAYGNEPFIRIVKTKEGIYRYPQPKILSGSNYCDIGFEKDENSNALVVISAIDNLVKGAAGNCVQAMNLMFGWEETLSLEFTGLHPA